LNKYNEIMEHIEVSDEMKRRVLKNIEKHFEEKELEDGEIAATILRPPAASRTAHRRKWIKIFVVLAATMILCVCPILIMKNQTPQIAESSKPNQNAQDKRYYKKGKRGKSQKIEQDIQKLESIQDLSEAVGFIVPEIDGIPFDVTNVEYLAKDGSAEIVYSGESGRSLQFSMSKGVEDYSEYLERESENIKTIKVSSLDVTIFKETEEKISYVVWTDGEYMYSLDLDEGTDEASVVRMVESLIKNK